MINFFQPAYDAIAASLSKKEKMPGAIHSISNESKEFEYGGKVGHACNVRFANGGSWLVLFTHDDNGQLIAEALP
jgi:hypothetical protein